MITRRRLFVLSSASVLVPHFVGSAAHAQRSPDWPNRVVRVIVPVAAGGPTDTVARVLAEQLSKIWGHQVVVENKGGAGTNLANEMVARSDPDGYTVLYATASLQSIGVSIARSATMRFPIWHRVACVQISIFHVRAELLAREISDGVHRPCQSTSRQGHVGLSRNRQRAAFGRRVDSTNGTGHFPCAKFVECRHSVPIRRNS
jgi:hypothetical protein